MSLPVIVIGAGGHGKVVADALVAAGRKVLGFVDPGIAEKSVLGLPVLGDDDALRKYSPARVELANGRGSDRDMLDRHRVFALYKEKGFRFAQVIHPSAILSKHREFDEGVQIMAGAVVQAKVKIGLNCIVNTCASIDHDCRIGPHCHIAPGATLSGNVRVGTETHIGVGATVIQGVTIGRRVTVAAGAVVVKDVAAGRRVSGVPAEPMPG